MTKEQKELVQTSFDKVKPISDAAAILFYDQLFAMDPSLRSLFKSDLTEQRTKLMAMLATAVTNLGRWESLVPHLRELGRRHLRYGVKSNHYETVRGGLTGDPRLASIPVFYGLPHLLNSEIGLIRRPPWHIFPDG